MIDGQECATNSFYTEKFYEAQKYWSLTRHVFTNFLWYANKDFMERISEEERTILLECAKEAIDYNWKLADEAEAETLKKLEQEGVQVNEVDKLERRKMGMIMNGTTKGDIISLCGEETYETLMDAVEEQREG